VQTDEARATAARAARQDEPRPSPSKPLGGEDR
jgi:hypothetical protein